MEENLDLSLDNDIIKAGLKWLPWIGKDYLKNSKRLLIVGESHYENASDQERFEQNFKNVSENTEYTRKCIFESAVMKKWQNNTYDNMHRALLKSNNFNKIQFWQNVSFYNFIQRLMDYRKRERPNDKDFTESWRLFLKLIEIIKPTDCIFIGVEAANFYNEVVIQEKIKHSRVKLHKKLNSVYPRTADIEIGKHKTKLIFMKHSSQMFKWSSWHKFLKDESPELMHFLSQTIKVINDEVDRTEDFVESQIIRCKKIPTWLTHKPIIASNYAEFLNPEKTGQNSQYLSIGHSQFDKDTASVKMFRHTGKKWSRQSEELPLQYLSDMMILLATTIRRIQNENSEKSILNEEVLTPDDLLFLEKEITRNKVSFKRSLFELKKILNQIDIDKI